MRDIAKNLKSLREQKGLKQEELAEKLFVTRQTISNYENGRSRPDIEMLMRIAEIMETDVNSILYGPPVPEDKRRAHRQLFIAAVLTAIFLLLWGIKIFVWDKNYVLEYNFPFTLFYLVELCFKPTALLLFGWTLMHSIGIFCKAKPLDEPWIKYLRWATLTVTTFFVFWILNYFVYYILVWLTGSTDFPYRYLHEPFLHTIFNRMELFVVDKVSRMPVIYFLLGTFLWLFGFPQPRKKNTIEKSE